MIFLLSFSDGQMRCKLHTLSPVQRLMQRKILQYLRCFPCEESGAFFNKLQELLYIFFRHACPRTQTFSSVCLMFAGALLSLLVRDGPGPAPPPMVR